MINQIKRLIFPVVSVLALTGCDMSMSDLNITIDKDIVVTKDKNESSTIDSIDAKKVKGYLVFAMRGQFAVDSHIQLFIDSDNNPDTGYSNGVIKGADYLIEDKSVYMYPEDVNGKWDWGQPISGDIIVSKSASEVSIKIPIGFLDYADTIRYGARVYDSSWTDMIAYDTMKTLKIHDAHPGPKPKPKMTINSSFHWQLQGKLNMNRDADVYDIDLFDNTKETISELHEKGRIVICYFSAGSYEEWRADHADFPEDALGEKMDGWDERWLDIRNAKVREIMADRIKLARSKGCDGVEADNVDGYTNKTGFDLSSKDQIEYNRYLADTAHKHSLIIGLKNDIDQVEDLAKIFDFAINEQCHEYNECGTYNTFTSADKPVFNIEYAKKYINNKSERQKICIESKELKIKTYILPLDLDDSFMYSCDQNDEKP